MRGHVWGTGTFGGRNVFLIISRCGPFSSCNYRRYVLSPGFSPSPNNKLEFCLGTLGEMTGDDFYAAVESYSRQQRLGYVHFRNVAGRCRGIAKPSLTMVRST